MDDLIKEINQSCYCDIGIIFHPEIEVPQLTPYRNLRVQKDSQSRLFLGFNEHGYFITDQTIINKKSDVDEDDKDIYSIEKDGIEVIELVIYKK